MLRGGERGGFRVFKNSLTGGWIWVSFGGVDPADIYIKKALSKELFRGECILRTSSKIGACASRLHDRMQSQDFDAFG